ncbi:MAG: 4-hydroxy-tetrahydrodipicolinate synthase [Kofleriaceae bacterium]
MKLEGCLTALVTPFKGGRVDFDSLARLVDWQIESGVDGIVSVGTTGESATLDVEEHVAVIAATVKAAKGRVPVIAGAGGNATAEALALTKASEDAGADALLHVTPYYNRPNQEGLYQHFAAIARATKLPVVLYNVPTRTACDMLTDTVVRLCEFQNIVAIKEALGNMVRGSELLAKVGDRLSVLSGDDGTAFPFYALGARGVISVVSNVAPKDWADMWDHVKAGRWDAAKKIHYKLRHLNNLLFNEPSPAPTKAALAMMDRCSTDVRLPLVSASAKLTEEIRAEMHAQGML